VTDGKVPASNPVSLTKPGTYYWEASYSGDTANAPSKSTPGSEVEKVTAAGGWVVKTSPSSLRVGPSAQHPWAGDG
jgi:hypothetical protein